MRRVNTAKQDAIEVGCAISTACHASLEKIMTINIFSRGLWPETAHALV
jgi:hypothetical protein